MVCLCIQQLFGLWLSLGFDFRKCKYAQLHIFFPPNLHAPCIPRYRFYFIFMIGFNFFNLFKLCFLDFADVILASLHDRVSYFTFIVLFQRIQIMCVWFLFQFLIFIFCYFEFYVVINAKVNIQNFLKLSCVLHGLATSLYIIYYI